MAGQGEGDVYQIGVEEQLNALLFIIEAYKEGDISLAELINAIVDLLYQQ